MLQLSVNWPLFNESVALMWKGMLGIFVVMIVIALIVSLLKRTDGGKKE